MTKTHRSASKLSLDRATIRVLTHAQLDGIHGGSLSVVMVDDAKKTTWTRTHVNCSTTTHP